MKKMFVLIIFSLTLFCSCTSSSGWSYSYEVRPEFNASSVSNSHSADKNLETNSVVNNSNNIFLMSSDIFDTLQRPLGFVLSSQCKPISRLNWEYHMSGIGWWDIYLMTGRKLGNGIYEKSIENKSNCQIIELHNTRTQYDDSILSVEIIFVSSKKSALEKLQSDFHTIATQFTGKAAINENDGIKNWESGWIQYTSYPIQYHESGKWIYLISSFDSAHSPY